MRTITYAIGTRPYFNRPGFEARGGPCAWADNRGVVTPTLNVIAKAISLIEARVSDLLW